MPEEQTKQLVDNTLSTPKGLNVRDLSYWAAQPPDNDEVYPNYWTLRGWKAVLSSF